MIAINFGEHAGGEQSFKTGDEVVAFILRKRDEWANHDILKAEQNPQAATLKGVLFHPWQKIHGAVMQAQVDLTVDSGPRLNRAIQASAFFNKLVARDSQAGQAIVAIYEEMGPSEAMGAAKFYSSGPADAALNGLPKAEVIGAVSFIQHLQGLNPHSVKRARDGTKRLMNSLQTDVAAHRLQLEVLEHGHQQKLQSLLDAGKRQEDEFTEWKTTISAEIRGDRDGWETAWEELYKLFTERLRLESAVKLWNDRADKHNVKATQWRNLSLGTAICGLAFAGLFAWGMLDFAKWLFSDALSGAEAVTTASGLRPTWQFEVIFASATTLLYLTVYFWIMRIIVRLYMTEAHLEIDARSRSAMAETYLALTKESAATDADRAIVLASLFRPIADGIVSDDGLPAITPAAILSGWAGGKS